MNQVKIKITNVAQAQEFVNLLGEYPGDFYFLERNSHIDAKSILGVVTLVSKDTLTLCTPSDFSVDLLKSFC